ncbi:aromatic acid exporter family protein [Streptomyces sp. NPDC059740]|uniref:FUSC family protein n=1 Tax=Streptomyces sp. NPDC059740 TaxID=3346926 RepID=UPI00365467D7
MAQTLRATTAATIAYAVATQFSHEPAPLTAPLTALLVVQVTLYATLTMSVRRVNAVAIGVMMSIGVSTIVGLHWWSLAGIILLALTVARFVRVYEFVNEVAISAMLVLGMTNIATQAWDRVLETIIGAVIGLAFNLFFAPPLWVTTAGRSIEDLARRMRMLLVYIGEALGDYTPVSEAAERLYAARQLDQDVSEVDEALRQAEDSLRLNPRVREGLLSRLVLRTGLDTLEICVVNVRTITRTLTDLAKRRGADEPLFPPEVAGAVRDLFTYMGHALVSFAVLVSTQVSANADEAESRLTSELASAIKARDRMAELLLGRVQEYPLAWQLQGALLAEVDRILDELDAETRTQRLMEELDRTSAAQGTRFPLLARVRRYARGEAFRTRRG